MDIPTSYTPPRGFRCCNCSARGFSRAVRSLSPLSSGGRLPVRPRAQAASTPAYLRSRIRSHSNSAGQERSEEHTSELQSRFDLVCRLLLEQKNQDTEHRNLL